MEIWVCLTAFIASLLTFFSGFGLGTLLLPVFAFFFSLETAVALTAIVHLANNIFKSGLVFKHMNWRVIRFFGINSLVAAFIGASVLKSQWLSGNFYTASLLGAPKEVSFIQFIIALLMLLFALIELIPRIAKLQFEEKHLQLGGFLSGFFGGLSGHQGVLRSMFLLRLNLSKEQYIATGVAIACGVDIVRLAVYSPHILLSSIEDNQNLLIYAILSAFAGALIGNRFLKKITLSGIQYIVAGALILFAAAMALGLI